MVGFNCFDSDSYEKLRKLHREKVISNKFYHELEDSFSYKKTLEIIENNLRLNKENIKNVYYYIKTEVELKNWDRENQYRSPVLNCQQSIFFTKLLFNGGVYSRDKCQKELLTDSQIFRYIPELEELNLIISLKTKRIYGSKTIYLLHPEIIQLIKNEQS